MRKLKFLPALIGATAVVAIILYVAFYFIFLDLFVDLWWFQSLKLESYFWLKLLYKFFLSGAVTLVFLSSFFPFLDCVQLFRFEPAGRCPENLVARNRFQRMANVFTSGSIKIYTPISLVLAIFIAIPFYTKWETSLLYFLAAILASKIPFMAMMSVFICCLTPLTNWCSRNC